MNPGVGAEPGHQLRHQRRHIERRRRRVDDFLGEGVGDVVLNVAVLPGRTGITAHVLDQAFVNLAQQAFGDRFATAEVSGDQVKGFPVVEEFAGVVGIDVAERFTGQQLFRLVEREMGAFDVSGIMSFENQRALLHAGEPIVGQARRLQEATRSLDASQGRGNGIGNGEDRRHGAPSGRWTLAARAIASSYSLRRRSHSAWRSFV